MNLMNSSKINHLNVLIRSVEDMGIKHSFPVPLSCLLSNKKISPCAASIFMKFQFFPEKNSWRLLKIVTGAYVCAYNAIYSALC